jgi:hypothetical protein
VPEQLVNLKLAPRALARSWGVTYVVRWGSKDSVVGNSTIEMSTLYALPQRGQFTWNRRVVEQAHLEKVGSRRPRRTPAARRAVAVRRRRTTRTIASRGDPDEPGPALAGASRNKFGGRA